MSEGERKPLLQHLNYRQIARRLITDPHNLGQAGSLHTKIRADPPKRVTNHLMLDVNVVRFREQRWGKKCRKMSTIMTIMSSQMQLYRELLLPRVGRRSCHMRTTAPACRIWHSVPTRQQILQLGLWDNWRNVTGHYKVSHVQRYLNCGNCVATDLWICISF